MGELRSAVVDDRSAHGPEDAVRNVGGAGDLKEVTACMDHGTSFQKTGLIYPVLRTLNRIRISEFDGKKFQNGALQLQRGEQRFDRAEEFAEERDFETSLLTPQIEISIGLRQRAVPDLTILYPGAAQNCKWPGGVGIPL